MENSFKLLSLFITKNHTQNLAIFYISPDLNLKILQKEINNISQIFREIGTRVQEQRENLNSMESSVKSTEIIAHNGADQVKRLEIYKNQFIKRLLVLVIIGSTVMSLFFLYLMRMCSWQMCNSINHGSSHKK